MNTCVVIVFRWPKWGSGALRTSYYQDSAEPGDDDSIIARWVADHPETEVVGYSGAFGGNVMPVVDGKVVRDHVVLGLDHEKFKIGVGSREVQAEGCGGTGGQMNELKTLWSYGRLDGEDLGDYTYWTTDDEDGAKGLAVDAFCEEFESGAEPAEMIVYEMIPRWIGRPLVTVGEALGDGDKEPDEFDRMEWVAAEAQEDSE